jgi:hypothetical protein
MISDLRDFCDACNKMQQVVQVPLAAQATDLFPEKSMVLCRPSSWGGTVSHDIFGRCATSAAAILGS